MAVWVCGMLDSLMQEFYQIVQGINERVQTFVLHFEWASKAIKQQHPHAMTKKRRCKTPERLIVLWAQA